LPQASKQATNKLRLSASQRREREKDSDIFVLSGFVRRQVCKPKVQVFSHKTKMVGIFSRFTVGRVGHRRTQSALDEREVLPSNADAAVISNVTDTATHGIEVATEFKPVEHPIEPFDNDRPIQCPLPEPSILNDGRIWKERVSANVKRRGDLPVMMEDGTLEPESTGTRPPPTRANRLILPSLSAPEHNLLKLLEECNASGI
jgi:hypothetical protein